MPRLSVTRQTYTNVWSLPPEGRCFVSERAQSLPGQHPTLRESASKNTPTNAPTTSFLHLSRAEWWGARRLTFSTDTGALLGPQGED